VQANKEDLDKLTQNKHFVPMSPPKVLPPPNDKFTPIANFLGVCPGVLSQPFIQYM